MAVKITAGMNILDAALASANSLEDLFALARLNGSSITADLAPGTVLQSTGLLYQVASRPAASTATVNAIKVLSGQTLADLALQKLGSLEGFFALAQLNGMGISDDLTVGQSLNYSLTPYNKEVAQEYQNRGYLPASGDSRPGQSLPIQPQGVGYWIIQTDFKVS